MWPILTKLHLLCIMWQILQLVQIRTAFSIASILNRTLVSHINIHMTICNVHVLKCFCPARDCSTWSFSNANWYWSHCFADYAISVVQIWPYVVWSQWQTGWHQDPSAIFVSSWPCFWCTNLPYSLSSECNIRYSPLKSLNTLLDNLIWRCLICLGVSGEIYVGLAGLAICPSSDLIWVHCRLIRC